MKEIWKPAIYPKLNGTLIDFTGLYEVSDCYNVRSVGRFEEGHYLCSGGDYYRKSKPIKQNYKKNGRLEVTLYLDGKPYFCLVHRLVAFAFPEICGEYYDGAVIDHIDTNPLNCFPSNLRWCTQKQNINNPQTIINKKNKQETQFKPVSCSKNGVLYKTFNSITDAKNYFKMKSETSIINCLKGRSKTAYGFSWEYA